MIQTRLMVVKKKKSFGIAISSDFKELISEIVKKLADKNKSSRKENQ